MKSGITSLFAPPILWYLICWINLKQVQKFSTEQLYILTSICDNIGNKSKVFKEELAKRVKS